MGEAQFLEVNPVLPVRNIKAAIQFYTEKLGFQLLFQDNSQGPGYAVVGRSQVHLHLQGHDPVSFQKKVEVLHLRFLVDDVDSLFEEYQEKGVFHERTHLADTPWGTREFAFYDLDGNGLFFYRSLKP